MKKIKKIEIKNLKAISSAQIDLNGCSAIITAANDAGKTTLLNAIPERIRGEKPELILKQGELEGYGFLELTSGEVFKWMFDDKKEKLIFITPEGYEAKITKEISNKFFPSQFDMDEFLQAQPKKQSEILQKLTGMDFAELDRKYKEAYAERTKLNTIRDNEKVKLQPVREDLPEVAPTINDISKKMAEINTHNTQWTVNQSQLTETQDKIKRAEQILQALKEEQARLEQYLANNQKISVEEVQKQFTEAEELKNKIVINNAAKQQRAVYLKAINDAKKADEVVRNIQQEKSDKIKSFNLPAGFEITEEGLLVDGLPLSSKQLSKSKIYISALKLAILTLGEVKAIHFDASPLDKKNLEEIQNWAQEQGLQLLIELPDTKGETNGIEYHILSDCNEN